MRRYIWAMAVGLIILLAAGIVMMLRGRGSSATTTIAIVSSLTGDLAENGKDMANGARMAFDEMNSGATPGVRSVHVEIFDDQGDPKAAVSIAKRISQDKRFVAVVGHLTSGCMSAAAPVYFHADVPVVMPVPTNPKITRQRFSNLFRVPPTDDDQAPFLARYLLSKAPRSRVAVVNDMTAYGTGFAEAFRRTFQSGGGNVVAYEGAQKGLRDFRTVIAKLKAQTPDYVVLGATYDLGAPFIRQMRELGLRATVLSGDGCYGSAFTDQARNAAEGTIVSFIAPDRGSSVKTEQFFKRYESKYGKVVSFAPLGYDAAMVVATAAARCHQLTRRALIAEMHSPDFKVAGVTGNISFESNGDNRHKNLVLYVVKNGRYRLLK